MFRAPCRADKGWQVWPNLERWSFQYHSGSPYYQSQLGTNWWNSTQILNKIQSVNTERKPFKGCRSRNICFFSDQIVIFVVFTADVDISWQHYLRFLFYLSLQNRPWKMHIRRLQSDLETNKDLVRISKRQFSVMQTSEEMRLHWRKRNLKLYLKCHSFLCTDSSSLS